MVAFPRLQLIDREPMQGDDLFVERAVLVEGTGLAGEAEAEERDVFRCIVPAVDAHERARLEVVRRLLQHLAAASSDERLARIQVAGRLIEHQPAVDPLFDEKEPPAALDHRGDGNARLPDHAAFRVFLRMKSAMRSTPASIADLEAAYEKRTCWPSPGTRLPKWMSASTATPASLSRRCLKSSESAAPMRRQASVTFGQT